METNDATNFDKDNFRGSTEKMNEEPIRPSEDQLRVFISSRQDEELSRAR